MTATENIFNPRRPAGSNSSVIRLERINKDLHSLRSKLSCYTCEPKTLSLYELKEKLKFRLDNMSKANRDLILKFKSMNVINDKLKKRAIDQFDSFKELENKVQDYIRVAKLH